MKEIAVYFPLGAEGVLDPVLGRVQPKGPYLNKLSGYERFFKELVRYYESGYSNFLLHLPFGRETTYWPMDFDAAPALTEAKRNKRLPRLSRTTPENFTFWAGWFLSSHKDAAITFYLGSLGHTKAMIELAQSDTAGYYRRFADSVAPITDINVQYGIDKDRTRLAIDGLGNKHATFSSLQFKMAETLKTLGYWVAVEPHFKNLPEQAHLLEYPVVADYGHWHKAWAKHDAKPFYKHATVLVDRQEKVADIDRIVRDEHIDCVAAIPGKLALVAKALKNAPAQQEAETSVNGIAG